MKPSRISTLFLLALLALAAPPLACRPSPSPAPERPNVLLIVVDTLRADRLGCYGGVRGLTPRLDSLAAEGVRFARVTAHSPWTLPSVASLLTSLHPSQHGAGRMLGPFQFTSLPEGAPTLARRFQEAGYATAAVVNVDFLTGAFGLGQGFEHLDHATSETNTDTRRAAATTDAALSWLRTAAGRPYFLFVHYFDPHLVYDPPPEFRRRFARPPDQAGKDWLFGTKQQMTALRGGSIGLRPEALERLAALYDGEVAFADREIGRLVAGLDELGLRRSTLVAVTADHGEEFGEHGGFEHGHTLYEELLRVPLILRLPDRLPSGLTVEPAVRQVDVAPTLLELAGIGALERAAGRSLLPLIEHQGSTPAEDEQAFAEGNFWGPPLYSWRSGGFKLIHSPGPGRTELYDLRSDPRETRDLSTTAAETREALLADLRLVLERLGETALAGAGEGQGGAVVTLTPEQRQRLEALGYLDGAPDR